MTTLKELNKLAEQQANGAEIYLTIEPDGPRIPVCKLDVFEFSEYKVLPFIGIQQPPEQLGYEWCGYGVPCLANCDAWLEEVFGTLKAFSFEHGHKPNMHNNGYRHLLQSLPESKVICGSASTCPYAKNNGCQHATPHYDSDDVCLCGCSKIDGIRGATCVPYVEPVMMICDHAETCGAPRGYCKHAEPHACKGEEAYFRCMGSCGEPTKCIPCVEPKHPEFVPYTLDTFDYKFTHLYLRDAAVAKLKADGFSIASGFDPDTGDEVSSPPTHQ